MASTVKWAVNNYNRNVTNLLNINLINGNKSSKDDSARKAIGKEAMSKLLKSIDNSELVLLNTINNNFNPLVLISTSSFSGKSPTINLFVGRLMNLTGICKTYL